jgi:RecA/RadA recombinase
MAKKTEKKQVSFSELNDVLNKFSPDGDILEDSVYARIDEFIGTGSYILNAALSGSLFGGMPNRRSLTFAGVEGSGKTYLALSICRNAQAMGYTIIYCDSEGGIDIEFVRRLGVDTKKFRIEQISTIEEFATFTAKLNETLKGYRDKGLAPPKVMVVLDSLGNLSSTKEKEDTTEGSGKRDMTKQQAIRRTFRVVGNDFAKNAVPFIICNHVYDSIGSFFGGKTISGGGGILYNSSMIFMLTKSKLTDTTSEKHVKKQGLDQYTKIGIVVTVNPVKQRFARPIKVHVHIPFYKKPNPFVGLEAFTSWESCGIVKGKCLSEKDYKKLSENDQKTCQPFDAEDTLNVTSTVAYNRLTPEERMTIYEVKNEETGKVEKFVKKQVVKYVWPKETARTLVCKHLGGEVPREEFYTDKVLTHSILTKLDETIIKPLFMLPSVESLEDLADVTADLEGYELDDTELAEE